MPKYRKNRTSHSHRIVLYVTFNERLDVGVVEGWVTKVIRNPSNAPIVCDVAGVDVADVMGAVEE